MNATHNLYRSLLRLPGAAAAFGVLALSEVAALAAPRAENSFFPPHDASTDGHRVDWLISITNVFITVLFVIMVIWMVTAVLKHGPKHQAEYDHGSSKHSVMTAFAISAVIFFVVDGNLWVSSTKDLGEAFWNYQAMDEKTDVVRIELNARQWIWQARYAGPDHKFNTKDDVIVTNDIRVPVDTPVLVQLASPDVIHSMTLVNFRVKQDAMPGTINHFWFQAKETGEFEISCGQHCGHSHYKMRGVLTVLPKPEFDSWQAQASNDSSRVWDEDDAEAHWGWDWRKI
jgi:cytochrome c oxidase subunit 2